MEIWKDITGYEGLYMVSNKGRVKSLTTGKIRAFFDNGRGYLSVSLYKNNIGNRFKKIQKVLLDKKINLFN